MSEGKNKPLLTKEEEIELAWKTQEARPVQVKLSVEEAHKASKGRNLQKRRVRNRAALRKLEEQGEGALTSDEKRWAAKARKELTSGKNPILKPE